MPTPALLLFLSTLLPLISFGVLVFLGKRLGNPISGYVGIGFIALSWACSLAAMIFWFGGGIHHGHNWGSAVGPIDLPIRWIPVGTLKDLNPTGYLDLGIYIDSLTVAMFNMITLVATLVHVFSLGYMRQDKEFSRFFTYLSLFCFSMLGLVIGGTLLHIFIFWELVGLCSYLLIGFWHENRPASNAAIKAFIVNRVGDVGFLIGFGILFYHLGNVSLPQMWVSLGTAGGGGAIALPGNVIFPAALLTVVGIGLFFGAIGKSAQFPLHVWLPDAMDGPTPISALIHAATMVAAGVYLMGRVFPILTPDAKLFIAIIGCITLTIGALIAVAQSEIKRILAFSTISQLGYMMLALGVGSWTGGLFHLITHAFFKALLFLGAGSVIHAAHHELEITEYGGLWRKLPITAVTFGIGVLALAGAPFFSGYYSKDMILQHAGAFAAFATGTGGKPRVYWAFFILPAAVSYLTAFYMTRCWMLTFWGKPRNPEVYEQARERPIMWAPLIVLGVLAIIAGSALNVRGMLASSVKETNAYCTSLLAKPGESFAGFAQAWPVPYSDKQDAEVNDRVPAMETGHKLVERFVLMAFIVGIGLGVLIYLRGYSITDRLMRFRPMHLLHVWLYRRMYFDELYFSVFVGVTVACSWLTAAIDRYVIDGAIHGLVQMVRRAAIVAGVNDRYIVDGMVNGAARLTQELGVAVRTPQTGRIRVYVTVLMAGVGLGLAGAIMIVLSK